MGSLPILESLLEDDLAARLYDCAVDPRLTNSPYKLSTYDGRQDPPVELFRLPAKVRCSALALPLNSAAPFPANQSAEASSACVPTPRPD